MEITTTQIQPAPLANPLSSQERKKISMSDSGNENEEPAQVADDAVLISKNALKLAQNPSTPSITNLAVLKNGDQARKVADQVVTDMRGISGGAESLYGNLQQVNLKLLLE